MILADVYAEEVKLEHEDEVIARARKEYGDRYVTAAKIIGDPVNSYFKTLMERMK